MYRRLTKGLNSVGKLIPETDDVYQHIKNKNDDYYLSIYKYTEDQKKVAEEIIEAERVDKKTKEVIKYKRPRGVVDVDNVVTNLLAFDLDSKKDLNLAKKDTIAICERLHSMGIPYEEQNIAFSGGKGFSVTIVHDKNLTPDEHQYLAENIAGDLKTFDTTLYNASRIFRINNTKHNTTGLYKTPLNFEDLKIASIEDIKEAAKIEYAPEAMIETKLTEKFLNIKPKEKPKTEILEVPPLNFKNKPFFFTDVKYALHSGYIPEGYGNTGMMILCSTYKHLGYSREDSYYALKAVNEKRASIYGIEKRPKDDIWQQIISVVYSPGWKGGTFNNENALIKLTMDTFGISEGSRLETFDNIVNDFFDFAENINENIVKTGIKSLDDSVLITTGMMVGVLGAPSSGKCLGKGTLVRMYDGSTKKVEDIKSGELLMGDDSKPRTVLSTCSGTEQLYKVKQKYGMDYIVNESHILSLKNNVNFSDKKRRRVFEEEIVDIDVKSYLSKSCLFKKHYKGYLVPVEYEEQELHLDPYVMGLWLGDGSSAKPSITSIDNPIINHLKTYFEKYKLTMKTENEITHNFTGPSSSPKGGNFFRNQLKGYEVFKNKHIPKQYMINSRENRLKLLAGLIDSDGSYDAKKKAYEISFKSNILAENTLMLIRSLGYRATSNKKQAKYKSFTKGKLYEGTSEVNRIYFSGKDLNELPLLLDRKKAEFNDRLRSFDQTPITIEKLDVGEYYGFEIDGNRRFLLEDYTVTHNTALVTSIIENHAKSGMKPLFCSLDMTKHLLSMRLLQRESGVSTESKLRMKMKEDALYNPNYSFRDDNDIKKSVENLSKIYRNVNFNFTRGATIESIEEDIKTNKIKHGEKFKLVVVDYLEKVRGPYSDSTANSGYVASRLSDLASTYEVTILLLLQPQKSAGDPSEPLLSMRKVKGASVIEQDCRVILTLWREGFNPQSFEQDKFASIAIVKNNMGEVRTLDYSWDGLKGQLNELKIREKEQLDSLRNAKAEAKAEEKNNNWGM